MFNSTALQTICSSVILSVFLPQQDVPLSTVLYSPHVEKHEAFIKYPCVSLDMSIELRIRSYGSEGHVGAAQMMKELGFEKNASVVRKKDKVKGFITDINDSEVSVQVEEGLEEQGEYTVPSQEFLNGAWKQIKSKHQVAVAIQGDAIMKHTAQQSLEVQQAILRGQVMKKLKEFEKKQENVFKGLKLTFRPVRNVITCDGFAKGKLILVPMTTKIDFKEKPGGSQVRFD